MAIRIIILILAIWVGLMTTLSTITVLNDKELKQDKPKMINITLAYFIPTIVLSILAIARC